MAVHDTDYIKIFFALLRSGLYGTPVPESQLPEYIDWLSVFRLAKKQAVFGLVSDSVGMLPERLRPSGEILAKMNKTALNIFKANMIKDQSVGQLVTFFRQHDINGVLLKGQGVARFYRMPQMRQSGDIDFYVGKKIYRQAKDLCLEKLADRDKTSDEIEHHFGFSMSGVPVELHRLASRLYSPLRMKRFQDWIEEELEGRGHRRTLQIGNTDVYVPSYDFDAIYIFYHAWRHYIMGGIGLRQLCDWALILQNHSGDIDRQQLKTNIINFGLTKGWKLFACIAVRYLGVSPEKIPLYNPAYGKKAEKILEEIIEGGNFGTYSKANTRTPFYGSGLRYGLGKIRNITEYFVSLFPVIPVEATFLYFNRLYYGVIYNIRRSRKKKT